MAYMYFKPTERQQTCLIVNLHILGETPQQMHEHEEFRTLGFKSRILRFARLPTIWGVAGLCTRLQVPGSHQVSS